MKIMELCNGRPEKSGKAIAAHIKEMYPVATDSQIKRFR